MRRLNPLQTIAIAIVLISSSEAARAAPVAVANAGFEDQLNAPNSFTFGAPTSWTDYNTAAVTGESIGTLNPATSTYFVPGQWEGDNVAIAFIQSGGTAGVEFGIRQTLSATLEAATLYELNVEVGNIASGTSDLGSGPVFFNLNGFPGYRIDLRAGDTVIASDDNSLHSGGSAIPEGEFRTSQILFSSVGVDPALIGQTLSIDLVNLNVVDPIEVGADREVDFDNVRLDAVTIPEPSSLSICSGLAFCTGLLRRRSRRRRDDRRA